MKSEKNIEKLIKRVSYKPRAEIHMRTLYDALEAQIKSRNNVERALARSNIWRTIIKSRISKIIAVALIAIAAIIVIPNFNGPVDLVSLSRAAPIKWSIYYGGNGHYYLPIVSHQQEWHRLLPLVRRDLQVFSCMQENT